VRLHHLPIAGLLVVALASASVAPASAAARAQAQPDRCKERPGTQHRPCVGPVTDPSGGGGDTLTIALSVVVGLAVAGVAFVVLRRQLVARTSADGNSG
jgi:uncharacterized protein HemX